MKVFFESLGCDKNLVDSEKMLGLLRDRGYSFTDDETEADVIVVNTCAFIGDAKKESIDAVLRLSKEKEEGACRALIVTGCMAERYKNEILEALPEIDGVLGIGSIDHIAEVVEEALAEKPEGSAEKVRSYENNSRLPEVKAARMLTTGGHYAHLKIAEGCDKFCTYCAIPMIRGRYRSVPMEQLLKEAEDLAARGVKELILVAQETTLYGTDLYGRKCLPELLRKLAAIPGLRWIRLLYGYPEELTDEMIEVIATEPKLCHYLDLPIQHSSDAILKAMGRKATREDVTALIRKLRARIPDIALRTTLMTGFPGETEEDHQANVEFVREMRFERLGVFMYSREEGTKAGRMKGQILKSVKKKRRDELMRLQQQIAFENAGRMPGRELTVMVEGQVSGENTYVARTYMDAPDVDGYLFFDSERSFMSGDFVPVQVTGAKDYDLIGELKDEFTE